MQEHMQTRKETSTSVITILLQEQYFNQVQEQLIYFIRTTSFIVLGIEVAWASKMSES